MSQIKIDPETMRQCSSRITQTANDLTSLHWEINRLANQLDWEVRCRGSVESKIGHAASMGKSLAQEAQRLSEYLKSCANAFEDADSKGQQSIAATASSAVKSGIGTGTMLGASIGGAGVLAGLIAGGAAFGTTALNWIKSIFGWKNENTSAASGIKASDTVTVETVEKKIWPVKSGKIIKGREFEAYNPDLPGDVGGHKGIDIGGSRGDTVISATNGTVVRADWSNSYGNVVYVNYGNYQIRYAHLDLISVKVGDKISAETPIGLMGDTGGKDSLGRPYCNGVHLHFEVRSSNNGGNCSLGNGDSTAINPEIFLKSDQIIQITTPVF